MLRLVKDRRVTVFILIQPVMSRSRHLLSANLALVLDEMEARGANSQFSDVVGGILAQLDVGELLPRRDRILGLIQENEWTWSRGIGIVSGRLGIDTADLIAERLWRPAAEATAALAACLADEPVGRQLVPRLLAYLKASKSGGEWPTPNQRAAAKALVRSRPISEEWREGIPK